MPMMDCTPASVPASPGRLRLHRYSQGHCVDDAPFRCDPVRVVSGIPAMANDSHERNSSCFLRPLAVDVENLARFHAIHGTVQPSFNSLVEFQCVLGHVNNQEPKI